MEKLSKRALGCMYVSAIIWAVVGMAGLIALNLLWTDLESAAFVMILSIVGAVVLVVFAVVTPYFRFHRYRYKISEEFIDIYEGYLFVTRNVVPLERLHKMKVARGPIDQLFKVAKVIVTTAGGEVTIRFLDVEKAERIAEGLGKHINRIVEQQRRNEG